MFVFVLRRLAAAVGIMLVASVMMYVLVINSGDPLADLRESTQSNREQLMARRIEFMGLDQPWYTRDWTWLRGVSGCFFGRCDFGVTMQNVEVNTLLGQAAASTLRLVLVATILALIFGIAIGVLTAVRQYSGLDYTVTMFTFLMYSVPVFWAAVLLKEYLAIGYNDWLRSPEFTPAQIAITAILLGVFMQAIMGGDRRRRLATFAVTAGFFALIMPLSITFDAFRTPQLGFVGVTILTFATAVAATAAVSGLRNRRVLLTSAALAALVSVLYLVLFNLFAYYMTWWVLFGGLALAIAVPFVVGRLFGGRYRTLVSIAGLLTTLSGALLTVTDHLFRAWPGFLQLKPRPISTIGSQTPNFTGDFWETFLDYGSQMLLPTILLTLISLASYSRYQRASMLEVAQQDYIRTAKAKGAPPRIVIFRHAFRNALIPIATIAAFDFASLIGGAVVTERVFGWKGMGDLFATGLGLGDPNPVMAFIAVTGFAAILFNMLADIFYAVIDPRIRV